MLFAGVHNEQGAGQLLHLADTAQVGFQLFPLVDQLDNFLLGQHVELTALLHLVDLVQALNTGADGLEVGQHTAQPAVVDVKHVAALGFGFYRFLGLLFGADEQDALAFHRDVADESISFINLADCLLQVDDVDAVTFGEDVLRHLRVPPAGLMTEVYAGFQKLFHGNDCHRGSLLVFFHPFPLCGRPPRCAAQAVAGKRCVIGWILPYISTKSKFF